MDVKYKVSLIDDEFEKYMLSNDENIFSSKVEDLLKILSNNKKQFSVSIVHMINYGKEPFFGMRVFPDKILMKNMTRQITNNKYVPSISAMIERWRNIREWEIEIDSRVFDRDFINFNPQELTAMLLHEIGHTIYSDKKIEMFCRVYRECGLRLSLEERAAAKGMYTLYMIPLTLVCGMREWKVTSNDLREEIFADQSVQKLGYGEYLISAYSKIIKTCGENGYRSDGQMETELETSINWCNLNMKDLTHRRDRLKDELYMTGVKTCSKNIKEAIETIMDSIGIMKKEKYTGNIVLENSLSINFDDPDFSNSYQLLYDLKRLAALEQFCYNQKEMVKRSIATEAFRKRKSDEVPSQLEVDTIFVEVDRIQNHADRRYVLDLIYHQEEKIQNFLELCDVNPELKGKYHGKMQSMLKELESMRQAVLAKRNFDKQYKVFVKYPAGYEG